MDNSTTLPEKHILPLDGLRGVAILMVILFHAFAVSRPTAGDPIRDVALYSICRWGFSGVDLFFVLSGFLITGILLRTRDAQNFYKVFYARRVLRIFPLYYLAVVIVFFVLPKMQQLGPVIGINTYPTPLREQLWFWFNVSNFRTAWVPMVVPQLSHFWTLAIEEQFYLVWPAIVRRASDKALAYICAAGFLLPLVLRVSKIVPTFGAPNFTYRITPFHMEGLCAGAALALLNEQGLLGRCRPFFLAAIAISAAGLGCSIAWPQLEPLQNSITTLLATSFTGLVGLCLLGSEKSFGLSAIFSIGRLRKIGHYSYFMYVFHLLILGEVGSLFAASLRRFHIAYRGADRLIVFFASFLILYATAALSNRYLEGPILALKRHFPYAKQKPALAT